MFSCNNYLTFYLISYLILYRTIASQYKITFKTLAGYQQVLYEYSLTKNTKKLKHTYYFVSPKYSTSKVYFSNNFFLYTLL
jgi:hypothetical protein